MAKKTWTQAQKTGRFWLWVAIFAMIFLILVAIGLSWFWDYIAAYEASRPQNAIAAYMQTATPQRLSGLDEETLAAADGNVQSTEACQEIIASTLQSITYAKNTKLTTDTEMVYMILNSGKSVGQVTMTVVDTDEYGFDHWAVTQEEFDFSYLLGESLSVTVPEDYPVYADGVLLDSSYITESGIHYPSVEAYYDRYDLPTMCTYTTRPILGTPVLTVTDPQGTPVTIDGSTDMEQFLKNCTQDELDAVEAFVDRYLRAYVDFTSVTGGQGSMQRNLNNLTAYMVSGGQLAQRMQEAVVGLVWVTDRKAELSGVDIHRCLRLEEGRYLCELTYVVDTRDYSGKVQSTSDVSLILVQTEDGLRVESMTIY